MRANQLDANMHTLAFAAGDATHGGATDQRVFNLANGQQVDQVFDLAGKTAVEKRKRNERGRD
jgi:hypothetical protein